jgi:hypothetical protein
MKGICKNTPTPSKTKPENFGHEEEEVLAKGTHNIFNKIITQNFPSLKKTFVY